MSEIFLVEPSIKYKNSFKNYVLAYKAVGDEFYYEKYKAALEDFDAYLRLLNNYSLGRELGEGDVTTSSFWLISEGEVVGVTRLRHEEVEFAGHIGYDISPSYRNKGFGFAILKLVLEKCKALDLKEPIITCHTDNLASRKIIEKNAGILLDTIFDDEENRWLYKYKIILRE